MPHFLDYSSRPRYRNYLIRSENLPIEDEKQIITEDEFKKLNLSPCKYCGAIGENGNGIDRVDSNRNYYLNNCVPCCKHCNYAKGNLSLVDWNEWLERISRFQIQRIK